MFSSHMICNCLSLKVILTILQLILVGAGERCWSLACVLGFWVFFFACEAHCSLVWCVFQEKMGWYDMCLSLIKKGINWIPLTKLSIILEKTTTPEHGEASSLFAYCFSWAFLAYPSLVVQANSQELVKSLCNLRGEGGWIRLLSFLFA